MVAAGQAGADADVVVIGGGFFGLRIALFLRERLGVPSVVVVEREPQVMSRASTVNQARVHGGYHYPRSFLTAIRSRANSAAFRDEFASAIVDSFEHYYAVARHGSQVNARQFETFCRRIGAPARPAPPSITGMFAADRVGGVYLVDEPAFDAEAIRDLLLERLQHVGGVVVRTGVEAVRVARRGPLMTVETSAGVIRADRVLGSPYSGINELHRRSGIEVVPVQHELAELALVRVPPSLAGRALTVVDGPFFSVTPYPSVGLHVLSHVRFTPHRRWRDDADRPSDRALAVSQSEPTNFLKMRTDAARFVPALIAMEHDRSLFEVKTVLARSAVDDSRPILYRRSSDVPGYTAILGGKLDNVEDVLRELGEGIRAA